jgi:acetolactate synthase-1/3 small subunit
MSEKYTLVITVSNRIGVLARISGLLSSRGVNIESIVGCRTENPDVYQVHLVIRGTPESVHKISKQVQKLIDTIKVVDIPHKSGGPVREFMFAKIPARKDRSEILDIVNMFGAKIVDISPSFLTVDLSGPTRKIDQFMEMMKPFGLREYIRSGQIAVGS